MNRRSFLQAGALSLVTGARGFRNILLPIFQAGNRFIINRNGLFVYNGPPALGNLIATIAFAAGTDPKGNAYLGGLTAYDNATGQAIQLSGFSLNWVSGGPGGPYVNQGFIDTPSTGVMLISPRVSLNIGGATRIGGVLTTQAGRNAVSPANPTSTASLTQVMMGLGGTCNITPGSSGTVLVEFTGTATTAVAVATVKWGGRFGTGAAPVNGAADTGTHFGPSSDPSTKPNAAGIGVPFAIQAVLVGLVPGTLYWFDLSVSTSAAADAAQLANLSFSAIETP